MNKLDVAEADGDGLEGDDVDTVVGLKTVEAFLLCVRALSISDFGFALPHVAASGGKSINEIS